MELKRDLVRGVGSVDCPFITDARGAFLPLITGKLNFAAKDVNVSVSRRGTIRGLHFNLKKPQAKFLKVLAGEIFDVWLDLRKDSPSFLNYDFVKLSPKSPALLLPKGVAHGFVSLDDSAVIYVTDEPYCAESDFGVTPSSLDCWPIDQKQWILSDRDGQAPSLSDFLKTHDYSEGTWNRI
jgi:dTDP-4-dehydrorhamnose 3,5-epimerase